jgi:hypothetical protein
MNLSEDRVLTGIDSGLDEKSQALLLDIDPDLSLEFLKAAAAVSGKHPPRRPSREELVDIHDDYVKKLLKERKGPRPVKKIILSLAYHPSTKSIRELKKVLMTLRLSCTSTNKHQMDLNELLVETHHENRVLIVKTIASPYPGAGIITIVEDETGYAERLAIYNQGMASILASVPCGCVLAIKEPYYKFNGDNDFMISVDHPSDVILLEAGDPMVPQAFQEAAIARSSSQWVSEGDAAFIARNLPEAIRWSVTPVNRCSEAPSKQ